MISSATCSHTHAYRGLGLPQKQCPAHQMLDEFIPQQSGALPYGRNMTSQLALSSPQMGDLELADQQTQWESNLGALAKDCYYCSYLGDPTGKCAQDSPAWGSGKNSSGGDCSSCGGTGRCRQCGGDGIIG